MAQQLHVVGSSPSSGGHAVLANRVAPKRNISPLDISMAWRHLTPKMPCDGQQKSGWRLVCRQWDRHGCMLS